MMEPIRGDGAANADRVASSPLAAREGSRGGAPDPQREALRGLLAAPRQPVSELCRRLQVDSPTLMRYWAGAEPMNRAVAIRLATVLEEESAALARLAAETRRGVWSLPATG